MGLFVSETIFVFVYFRMFQISGVRYHHIKQLCRRRALFYTVEILVVALCKQCRHRKHPNAHHKRQRKQTRQWSTAGEKIFTDSAHDFDQTAVPGGAGEPLTGHDGSQHVVVWCHPG